MEDRIYDRVLLKEVMHHIDPAERVAIFTGLRNGFVVSTTATTSTTTNTMTTTLSTTTNGDGSNRLNNHHHHHHKNNNNNNMTTATPTTSLLIITHPKTDMEYPARGVGKTVWGRKSLLTIVIYPYQGGV